MGSSSDYASYYHSDFRQVSFDFSPLLNHNHTLNNACIVIIIAITEKKMLQASRSKKLYF